MNDNILDYIKNEKDLSKYNLKFLLKKDISKSSVKRLINIEKEFISTPFEYMNFETVADVATAISIYRKSRQDFYQTYKIESIQVKLDRSELLDIFNLKKQRIKEIADNILWKKLESINVVQDENIFEELVAHEASRKLRQYSSVFSDLEKLSLDELLLIEPIKISKKRARLQILLFSIILFLKSLLEALPEFDENSSSLDLDKAIRYLDHQIDNIQNLYLKFYNSSIDILGVILQDSVGKNTYISKMHKLTNLLDFSQYTDLNIMIENHNISFLKPKINNLLPSKSPITFSIQKDKEKNIQNKTFGIILPIERMGNEKMTLMYKEIILDDVNISGLFSDVLSNIRVFFNSEESYYKSLLIKPIWQIYQDQNSIDFIKLFSKILAVEESALIDDGIFTENFKKNINNATNFNINVSNTSKILVPKTRSEEQAFLEIIDKVSNIIDGIKKEYHILNEEYNAISE